jgi:hypothetical protein
MRSPVTALAALLLLPALALAEPDATPAPAAAVPEDQGDDRTAAEREGVTDDGYRVSLSLPTEDDRGSWTRPGLRVDLAVGYGVLLPSGPSPRVGAVSFQFRPRLRIDDLWSIAATFGYGLARGDYDGVRYSALIEPVFHPLPSLGVSLGVGYAGFSVFGDFGAQGGAGEVASRTVGDGERLASCAGGGWMSQARVEYLAVVGPLFSTGPYLTADGQWTGCEESAGQKSLETGEAIVRRQWWLHLGGSLGWWLSWR